MTAPRPGDRPRPQTGGPGASHVTLDQATRDRRAVAAMMPTTADQALAQARESFIAGNMAVKAAQRLTFRTRKRKKLLDYANLAFAGATWLMHEEQRLRSAQQAQAAPTTGNEDGNRVITTERIQAYRAFLQAVREWRLKLDGLFGRVSRGDLRAIADTVPAGDELDEKNRAEMREAHDAVVAALSNVELLGTARAVQIGRGLLQELYRSCGILFDHRQPEMTLRERRDILAALDLAALIAEIRNDLGGGALDAEHGEPAWFAN